MSSARSRATLLFLSLALQNQQSRYSIIMYVRVYMYKNIYRNTRVTSIYNRSIYIHIGPYPYPCMVPIKREPLTAFVSRVGRRGYSSGYSAVPPPLQLGHQWLLSAIRFYILPTPHPDVSLRPPSVVFLFAYPCTPIIRVRANFSHTREAPRMSRSVRYVCVRYRW